jgi:hypothetical protein
VAASRARFGSLDVRVIAAARYVDLLPVHFRVWAGPDDATTPEVELTITDEVGAQPRVDGRDDELVLEASGNADRVATSITELVIERDGKPVRARLTVTPDGQDPDYVAHYVAMNVRALMRRLGRIQLHGAAATVHARTVVLLGDKGAGKSTLSVALGRAGGVVLADDQLILHVKGGVTISGVDGGLRLTAQTEPHFFATPLDSDPQDVAGTMNKEEPLGAVVDASPGVDAVPDACYFPSVGDRFEIVPISRAVAVQRLLDVLVPLHRFTGPSDQLAFVRAITTFVGAVEVFDLTLSPDLRDLDRVVAALSGDPR